MKKLRKVSSKKLKSSRKRHILKTISWRFIGSLDTFFLALLVGKEGGKASAIAFTEVVSKMILYYFHERIWYRIPFGISNDTVQHKRHLVKAISWRLIGTLDTVLLSWLILGDFKKGLSVGALELITKTVLYYFHERLWLNINLKIFNQNEGR